jgi:hypothetical protein
MLVPLVRLTVHGSAGFRQITRHILRLCHNSELLIYAQPGLSHRIVAHNQQLVPSPKTRPADDLTDLDITYAAAELTPDANVIAASRMWY